MRFDALQRNDWIVGGLALLLVIDLLFLPWYSLSGFGYSVTASATSAPDGWTGILAMLVLVVLIADLLIERLSPQTALPNLGGSRTVTRRWLAVIAAAFIALKFVLHLHFSWFGFGFYAAVVITAALVFATLRISQDRELPTFGTASS
ncbi:MAG TPA: hypothetical protein VHU61_10090 [Solirubrobacteraceae bacterium]|jgi:hypothetical protein|nr:hypothetical protein [Solirubrobacteraceae bacterium]